VKQHVIAHSPQPWHRTACRQRETAGQLGRGGGLALRFGTRAAALPVRDVALALLRPPSRLMVLPVRSPPAPSCTPAPQGHLSAWAGQARPLRRVPRRAVVLLLSARTTARLTDQSWRHQAVVDPRVFCGTHGTPACVGRGPHPGAAQRPHVARSSTLLLPPCWLLSPQAAQPSRHPVQPGWWCWYCHLPLAATPPLSPPLRLPGRSGR
jgi:hypothetical protein